MAAITHTAEGDGRGTAGPGSLKTHLGLWETIQVKSITKAALKKMCFLVQWVTRMMASRKAGKSFFFFSYFSCIEKILKILGGKREKSLEHEKNVPRRHL